MMSTLKLWPSCPPWSSDLKTLVVIISTLKVWSSWRPHWSSDRHRVHLEALTLKLQLSSYPPWRFDRYPDGHDAHREALFELSLANISPKHLLLEVSRSLHRIIRHPISNPHPFTDRHLFTAGSSSSQYPSSVQWTSFFYLLSSIPP